MYQGNFPAPVLHYSFQVPGDWQRMVRVVLIDDSPGRAAILEQALADAGYAVLARLGSGEDILAAVQRLQPDVVLVDTESPDRDTLEGLGRLHREAPRPVVMFAAQSDAEITARALRAGVSAYVVDGLQPHRLKGIMDLAIARFREFKALRDELDATRTELADRKAIERAKGILMKKRGLDEEGAHAALRKLAMDRGRRLGQVARDVIDMADLLG